MQLPLGRVDVLADNWREGLLHLEREGLFDGVVFEACERIDLCGRQLEHLSRWHSVEVGPKDLPKGLDSEVVKGGKLSQLGCELIELVLGGAQLR